MSKISEKSSNYFKKSIKNTLEDIFWRKKTPNKSFVKNISHKIFSNNIFQSKNLSNKWKSLKNIFKSLKISQKNLSTIFKNKNFKKSLKNL